MSNDYFDSGDYTALPSHSLARSAAVNSIASAIVAGFDKLPAELALKQNRVTFVASDTGAADAHVVSLTHAPAAYVDGLNVVFRAANTNTGAATINVNSLGVKTITNADGSALSAAQIVANSIVDLRYDATAGNFKIIGPLNGTINVTVSYNTKASSTDSTPGTLQQKLPAFGMLARRLIGSGADEDLLIKMRATQAVPITADATLEAGSFNLISTSGGAIADLDMPAIGSGDTLLEDGEVVMIVDVGGALETNNCTLDGNGKNIKWMDQSAAASVTLNSNFLMAILVWDSSADQWLAFGIYSG